LQDWLTARNPEVIAELREARRQDLAGNSNLGKPATCHVLPSRSRRQADAQLAALDAAIGVSVERKIQWLAANAPAWCIAGLWACLKIWRDSASSASATTAFSTGFIRQKLIRIYRIQHRSEIYRQL